MELLLYSNQRFTYVHKQNFSDTPLTVWSVYINWWFLLLWKKETVQDINFSNISFRFTSHTYILISTLATCIHNIMSKTLFSVPYWFWCCQMLFPIMFVYIQSSPEGEVKILEASYTTHFMALYFILYRQWICDITHITWHIYFQNYVTEIWIS